MHWGVVFIVVVLGTAGIIGYTIARVSLLRRHPELGRDGLQSRGGPPEWEREIDALRDELNEQRDQLAEVHERLDFAERMLTAGRAALDDRRPTPE